MSRLLLFVALILWISVSPVAADTKNAPPKTTGPMVLPIVPPGTSLAPPNGYLTGVPNSYIAPGYCPGGNLPQYCQMQSQAGIWSGGSCGAQTPLYSCIQQAKQVQAYAAYGCSVGSYYCVAQQQQLAAMGCPYSPYQASQNMCLQYRFQGQQAYGMPPNASQMMMPMMAMMGGMGGNRGGYGGGYSPDGDGTRRSGDIVGGDDSYSSPYYVKGDGNTNSENVSQLTGNAPILPLFKKYFPQCTEKKGLGACNFKNIGVIGDARHQAKPSCHNIGQAIDVGFLTCANGGHIQAYDPRFTEVAKCMALESDNQFRVIVAEKIPTIGKVMVHADAPGEHNDHMHIEIKGCMNEAKKDFARRRH